MLSAERSTYYPGEWFTVRTDPSSTDADRILLLSHRSPEGDTRLDEVQPSHLWMRISDMKEYRADPRNAEIDSGFGSRWFGLGEHERQLFQVDRATTSGEIHLLASRPLTVLIVPRGHD